MSKHNHAVQFMKEKYLFLWSDKIKYKIKLIILFYLFL